jgi:hypothetical protein
MMTCGNRAMGERGVARALPVLRSAVQQREAVELRLPCASALASGAEAPESKKSADMGAIHAKGEAVGTWPSEFVIRTLRNG